MAGPVAVISAPLGVRWPMACRVSFSPVAPGRRACRSAAAADWRRIASRRLSPPAASRPTGMACPAGPRPGPQQFGEDLRGGRGFGQLVQLAGGLLAAGVGLGIVRFEPVGDRADLGALHQLDLLGQLAFQLVAAAGTHFDGLLQQLELEQRVDSRALDVGVPDLGDQLVKRVVPVLAVQAGQDLQGLFGQGHLRGTAGRQHVAGLDVAGFFAQVESRHVFEMRQPGGRRLRRRASVIALVVL